MSLRLAVMAPLFYCLFTAPPVAPGQNYEFGVFGGRTTLGETRLGTLDEGITGATGEDIQLHGDNYTRGARITLNWWDYYGMEIEHSRTSATITLRTSQAVDEETVWVRREDRIWVNRTAFNMVGYMMPKKRRWRPFLTIGLNRTSYGEPRIEEWTTGDSANYGFNYGGGIKLKFIPHSLVRMDIRQYFSAKPYSPVYPGEFKFGGIMKHTEATVGVSVTF